MGRSLSFFSPAKINLFFRVLGKRSDGFHEIASLYQAIDLSDQLWLEEGAGSDAFDVEGMEPTPDNLVLRALALYREAVSDLSPVRLYLKKRIPIAAGLGGGSSNGATTLFALNEWRGRPLSLAQLAKIGEKLGSDVPFFFSSGSAYCTGRGEQLVDVRLPGPPLEGWLYTPPFPSYTAHVYRALRPDTLSPRDPLQALAAWLRGERALFNDLEEAVPQIRPYLARYPTARMTGSGSAFFSLEEKIDGAHFFRAISRALTSWYEPQYTSSSYGVATAHFSHGRSGADRLGRCPLSE
jgi:4-diphosphocytidyl-2-C-methyl-D-erythritol kinase